MVCSRIHSDCLGASGGGSILVHSSCPQRGVGLGTGLRAVAVSVALEGEIALCSICIPPSFALRPVHLDSLIQQLLSPFVLLGDFGGHGVLWGGGGSGSGGDLVEDFISQNDICLVNDGSGTFPDSGGGAFSALGLSVCHPSLCLGCGWSVCGDRRGGGHFPVVVESIGAGEEDRSPGWRLGKAGWDLFHALCGESLAAASLSGSAGRVADFTSSLVEMSEGCVPGASTDPKKSNPWYNDDCKEAIKQRKDTLSRAPCRTRANE